MDTIQSYSVHGLIQDLRRAAKLSQHGSLARVTIGDYEQCRQISTKFRVVLDEETGDVSIDCDPHQIP